MFLFKEDICSSIHFHAFQIAIMQKELQALQPKLVQTSLETEQLIKVIESEKEEVGVIKAVVEKDEAVANTAAMAAKAIKVWR